MIRRKKIKTIIKISLVLFLLTAGLAQAALVPCGRNEDSDPRDGNDETAPCTLCHLIVGFKGLIDYGLRIMIFVAFTGLVIAAVIYIVSGGSEQVITTAKNFIRHILYGFGIVLCAWLFIFVVMNYFGVKKDLGIGKIGWNKFECKTESQQGNLYPGAMPKDDNKQTGIGTTACSGYGHDRCKEPLKPYCYDNKCVKCWPADAKISEGMEKQCCSQKASDRSPAKNKSDIRCDEGDTPPNGCPTGNDQECKNKGNSEYHYCDAYGKCRPCIKDGERCDNIKDGDRKCCSGSCEFELGKGLTCQEG